MARTIAWLGALVLLIAFGWQAGPAGAQDDGEERALSFRSELVIGGDGTLRVTETIQIRARGRLVRHGIYRSFPTAHGVAVDSVSRNGAPERWRRETTDGMDIVWIGDPDIELPPGDHVYDVRYRSRGGIARLPDHDAFRWEAGSWGFPLDRVEIDVRLPGRARLRDRAALINGEAAGDAVSLTEEPGRIRFRTNRRLDVEEELAIGLAWPKGVLEPPR